MVEPEPEIWVPVQASYTNNTMFFYSFGPDCSGTGAKNLKMLEPESKQLDSRTWSRSLKFEQPTGSTDLHLVQWFSTWGRETYLEESRAGAYLGGHGVPTSFCTSNVTWRFRFFISISGCSVWRSINEQMTSYLVYSTVVWLRTCYLWH